MNIKQFIASKPAHMKCMHHFITYDPYYPYGCRALNFKSRNPPCLEVKASSGIDCQMYLPRSAANSRREKA